jgi:hypothetical protein
MSDKSLKAEIRITGVNKSMKKDLVNIRKNLGISESDMLKPVISKWISEQPERLKKDYVE